MGLLSRSIFCQNQVRMSKVEPLLFRSNSPKVLVKQLYKQIQKDCTSLFDRPLILVPQMMVKEWVQLHCVALSDHKAILGWDFATWQQGVSMLAGALPTPTRLDLLTALWNRIEEHAPLECQIYFSDPHSKLEFVEHLSTIFFDYSLYGKPSHAHWQLELFDAIFDTYSWMPLYAILQTTAIDRPGPLYLFGMDWFPQAAVHFFLHHPTLRIFHFSPTAMYWEDIRSVKERKALLARARKSDIAPAQIEAMDELLRQQHSLLSNWGTMGRKMGESFSHLEPIEHYETHEDPNTLLQHLQQEILLMEQREKASDPSVRIIRSGASTLEEIEALKTEILDAAARGIAYSEMRVYAPDIAQYAPCIQFLFSNIPYRVGSLDLARQSSYFQAFELLAKWVHGRWDRAEWFALLSLPAFVSKRKWQLEDIERIDLWMEHGAIRWGMDANHRNEVADGAIGISEVERGTWEKGLHQLLDSWIFFRPDQNEVLSWSDADLFQDFLSVFSELKEVLSSWKNEKNLSDWASEIEIFLDRFLQLDSSCEKDIAAKQAMTQGIEILRKSGAKIQQPVPFVFVMRQLISSSSHEIGASQLHAVRFHSLEMGSILPAKIIFFLGMDEESFPRASLSSSLHLLKAEGKYIPPFADIDRYLLLQAVFYAESELVFFYSHISKKDGKPQGPSFLLQELLSYLGQSTEIIKTALPFTPRKAGSSASLLISPLYQEPKTPADAIISLSELRQWLANPIKYYLRQIAGIAFKEKSESKWQDFESSSLMRYKILPLLLCEPVEKIVEQLREKGQFPLGMFGEELQRKLRILAHEMRSRMQEWEIVDIKTVEFRECASPTSQEPIEFHFGSCRVLLIGDAPLASEKGPILFGKDHLKQVLKNWPELLAAMIGTKSTTIFPLEGGKKRDVADPKQALAKVVELYLKFGQSPVFLHSEWADEMLRKNRACKMDEIKDPVLQWAFKRSPKLDIECERLAWTPLLQEALLPAIELFGGESAADV